MRRNIALMLAIGLLAAACSGTEMADPTSTLGGTTGTTTGGVSAVAGTFDPSQVKFVAALERFDSCDALLDHFQAEAKERVGPYGLDGNGGWRVFPEALAFTDDMAVEHATTEASATAPALAGEGENGGFVEGTDYSGTNVQVTGVDEPDIIKTDGTRIITIVDGKISYVDVTTEQPLVLGTLQLSDGWNHTLFVVDETAFVFSSGGGGIALPTDVVAAASSFYPGYPGNSSMIFEVDISDPANMKVTRTLTVEGRYLSARLIDGTVRMVISSYPTDLPFVYPSNEASEEIALEANRKVIDLTTLEDWLPEYTLVESDGSNTTGLLVACDRTHRPTEFAGFETLSVLTFSAGSGLDAGDAAAVIAGGETVYASTESIYVATNVWVPGDWFAFEGDGFQEFNESYSTAIHKFSINGSDPAEYEASGSVRGHLLNQFSMDEYDGYFRVATTDGPPWGFDDTSESFIVVLEQQGDQLVEVGSVGEMGKGERIFSVRFIGDAAYVVTFRQTDPLYVVDLSNPADPAVTGELKIPGYSAYLHPLGNGRLLGIGQDATEEGRTIGAKVSLFDVSDPSDPREIDNFVLPDSYTDAEWDHHAFLYWAPEQIMVMPLQSWQDDFAGAIVFKLDDGIREFGRITHDQDDAQVSESECQQYTTGEGFEEDMIVQVCGPTDINFVDGYYCEVLANEELEWIDKEFGLDVVLADVIGPEDHIEICWPEYRDWNPIQRSLVIGESLWTMSWRSLQSNTLADLTLLHQIAIG